MVQLDSHRDEAVVDRVRTLLKSECWEGHPCPSPQHSCHVPFSRYAAAREFVTALDLSSVWKVPLPIARQFLEVRSCPVRCGCVFGDELSARVLCRCVPRLPSDVQLFVETTPSED